MKISGAKAHVFFDDFDHTRVLADNGATEPKKWYMVLETGDNTNFPYKGSVIKSPSAQGAQQIDLVAGDKIFPLEEDRVCKTSASLSMEEGSVEVGDDCDPGASILDGVVKISGSLDGFFRYDDQTQEFDSVTDSMIGRFFDTVEDDGEGVYNVIKRNNGTAYLLICLNSDAKVGQIEHWLFIPAVISSLSSNLGNTDVQNRSISFTKGEGEAVHYKVRKTE